MKHRVAGTIAAVAICAFTFTAKAHHSFAMYDQDKTYVMTGVVVRVDPNPNHLQIFFVPLNEARNQIVRDEKGEPWVWAFELDAAAAVARDGITVNNFPRGTIFSAPCIRCARVCRPAGVPSTDCTSVLRTRRRRRASTATP
jgi:hypothetical protein